jgi:hypothetical protein
MSVASVVSTSDGANLFAPSQRTAPGGGAALRRGAGGRPAQLRRLHLFGVLCIQVGQLEQGAALIGQAIAIRPDVAAAHGNLANVLNRLGRHADAKGMAIGGSR